MNKPAWLVQQEREEAAAKQQLGGASGDPSPPAGVAVGENGGEDPIGNSGGDGAAINADGVLKEDNNDNEERRSQERDQFGRSGGGGGGRDYDDRPRGGGEGHRSSRDDYRDDRRGGGGRRDHRGGGGGHRGNRSRSGGNRSGIYFHSYEEEREWLEQRRRKRRSRKSLFDVEPSPEQLAQDEARAALERDHLMMTGGAGAGGVGGSMMHGSSSGGKSSRSLQPQQTRHARRLYIGNIPDIQETDVHNFFRDAIRSAIVIDPNNPNPSHQKQYIENDPIISVYINRERRCKYIVISSLPQRALLILFTRSNIISLYFLFCFLSYQQLHFWNSRRWKLPPPVSTLMGLTSWDMAR